MKPGLHLHGWGNLVGFQLVWIASVAGAAAGMWWAGPACLVLFAVLQGALGPDGRRDLRLLGLCVLIGLVVDTVWIRAGLMRFAAPVPFPGLAPVWILAMWAGFGLTLRHSLAVLQGRPWLAALLGLAGGPAAYLAAERAWGAVAIAEGPLPWVGLALAWAALTPLLLELARDRPDAAGTAESGR
ncbi:MAG: hypothetical protein KatS3mg126_0975 [Lysobacteraceae bacterium]|nr:MAG: hypothetical protein KatS3mg126_0975 [Xanthomonadaceae bacterium]